MSRLLIAIMIAAAALSAGAVSAEAACVVQRYTFRFDSIGPWPAFLAADSGRPCERGFRSGGQSVFKKLSILTDPANGRVDLVPGGRWRYTSRPGY